LRTIRQNQSGISNVIVLVLSLVILVTIVANIFLWNYQMNQLDYEKMREDLKIANVTRVTRSSWFVAQSEYKVSIGNHVNGTYEATQFADDNSWETFLEKPSPHGLDINGTFVIDLSIYSLTHIQTIEIQLRYRADDAEEKWYLKAYNWTAVMYSGNGFNSTTGHTPTTGWDNYAVNLTDSWRSYVRDDGVMYVKIEDEWFDPTNRTTIDIDFLGVRVAIDGARFIFENDGSFSSHIVSLWVNNSTIHQRYDINIIINSAETFTYLRVDIRLPVEQYTVKVVTERGNIAIYSGD